MWFHGKLSERKSRHHIFTDRLLYPFEANDLTCRLAEDYNLELQYRRSFTDIWKEEQDGSRELSKRMGVIDPLSGELMVTNEEMEAAGFYHAFCFYKV